jgi:uncharacterized protein YggU (UPF0235/DUF167 family)
VGGRYGQALVVAVTAPAVDGRATDAALKAVATALQVSPRDLRLVTGATSRTKVIEIANAGPEETSRLAALLSS